MRSGSSRGRLVVWAGCRRSASRCLIGRSRRGRRGRVVLLPVWVVRVLGRGSPLVVAVLLPGLRLRGKGLRR